MRGVRRLSRRKAELRAAGRQAYYDGVAMDRCPVRLREAMLWRDGWLSAQREVDAFIARQVEAAVERNLGRNAGRNAQMGV